MPKKAFVTIEAIIAFVILTFAILTTTSSMKTLNMLNQKKETYEDLYVTVLSLKDMIDLYSFENQLQYGGDLNGFKYKIKAKNLYTKRNKVYDDFEQRKVNGAYEVRLYKVVLNVEKRRLTREYEYYTTRQKKYTK